MNEPWWLVFAALLTGTAIAPHAEAAGQSGSWTRQPRDQKQAEELREYQKLVTAFLDGDERAADALLVWPRKQLADIVELLPPAPLDSPAWHPIQFKAAVMLQTTAAIHLLQTPDRADDALGHLELGTNVLKRGREGVRSFVGPWHTAMARLLLAELRLTDADAFLKHARDQFPDDPAILFMSGLFSEYMAGPLSFERLELVRAKSPNVAISAMLKGSLARRTERLTNAERWLRAALSTEAGNVENILHLGRVQMLREHDNEALQLFVQVEGTAGAPPELRYLAALFTGGLHERGGKLEEAITAYRRAVTLLPAAQSGVVALSEALRRAGRGDESQSVLQERLGSIQRVIDPWWTYLTEPRSVTAERIQSLFAEWRR